MDMADQNAPAKPAPPKLLGDRTGIVKLDYPVEYDGKVWTEIRVTRMTLAQVREFFEAVADDAADAHLPMFDAPVEVMLALDPDDDDKVQEALERFLPRRLRPAAEQNPGSGADTSQSSPAS